MALHEGELESLAWLTESTEPVSFCTADRAAVRALVFLGIADRAVSLETVLEQSAVARSGAGRLRVQFREQSLRERRRHAQLEKLDAGR
jgi:hypothetical protein